MTKINISFPDAPSFVPKASSAKENRECSSCCTLAVECDGHDIVTVEGIARDGQLHPVQRQFIEKWALQCGYCTPGMIMSAKALLDRNPHPTELEIREAIEGNLCRCTGYAKIVEAIQAAAAEMNWEEASHA